MNSRAKWLPISLFFVAGAGLLLSACQALSTIQPEAKNQLSSVHQAGPKAGGPAKSFHLLSGIGFAGLPGIDRDLVDNQMQPAVSFGMGHFLNLVVYSEGTWSGALPYADVYGQFVRANGAFHGQRFVIGQASGSQTAPSVTYNPNKYQWLVTWQDGRNGNADLYAQTVTSNGAGGVLVGGNVAVHADTTSETAPTVGFDAAHNKYLVTWLKPSSTLPYQHLYGKILDINTDGTVTPSSIPDIPISANLATDDNSMAQVTYNSNTQQFLVTWLKGIDPRPAPWNIYTRTVSHTGTLGTENRIFPTVWGQNQGVPSIAYNHQTSKYLVAWHESPDMALNNHNIYGMFLNNDGSPVTPGARSTICSAPKAQLRPAVAYNSISNHFVVAWDDQRNHPSALPPANDQLDLYTIVVGNDGSLGLESLLSGASGTQAGPRLAYNGQDNRLIAVWTDNRYKPNTNEFINYQGFGY